MQRMIAAARWINLFLWKILLNVLTTKMLAKNIAVRMGIFSPYHPTHLYLRNLL